MRMQPSGLGVLSRRQLLQSWGCGFGYLAFASLASAASNYRSPLAPRQPHFPARAKRVIFLFMQGAPSQYETFEYSAELASAAQKSSSLMAPAFRFAQHGQSGHFISELFPHLAKQADELCILNGLHTDSPAHPQATIHLHTGSFNFVRPSLGAWVVYGLGTENQDLPGFITINPAPLGGAQNYGSAFLPAAYQGTPYQTRSGKLPNIDNQELGREEQRKQLDLIQSLNRGFLEKAKVDPELEGVIESYELAFRMQSAVPKVLSLKGESDAIRKLYGLDDPQTRDFGTQCLLARRLAEAGVRFIEISHGNWDHHSNLRQRIRQTAREIDQPVAALIADLKQRDMLKDTLLVWGGEFGRTTAGQSTDGRNHNNRGFTMWMAGGGVKAGLRYGATDPVTGAAVEGKIHLHDLHATILHLLGLDHTRLTYRYGGRDFRLTDVHGVVAREILA
ncbi:MAG: DUF1501 domain-containing protein [Bryobacteraceae bacterium]|nr:DUF1501 domain-containing protein [Bryobacteraceae bacterium]MDW8376699.1 DUF1501 domain-containing protein [Bryobacterales bacterium]